MASSICPSADSGIPQEERLPESPVDKKETNFGKRRFSRRFRKKSSDRSLDAGDAEQSINPDSTHSSPRLGNSFNDTACSTPTSSGGQRSNKSSARVILRVLGKKLFGQKTPTAAASSPISPPITQLTTAQSKSPTSQSTPVTSHPKTTPQTANQIMAEVLARSRETARSVERDRINVTKQVVMDDYTSCSIDQLRSMLSETTDFEKRVEIRKILTNKRNLNETDSPIKDKTYGSSLLSNDSSSTLIRRFEVTSQSNNNNSKEASKPWLAEHKKSTFRSVSFRSPKTDVTPGTSPVTRFQRSEFSASLRVRPTYKAAESAPIQGELIKLHRPKHFEPTPRKRTVLHSKTVPTEQVKLETVTTIRGNSTKPPAVTPTPKDRSPPPTATQPSPPTTSPHPTPSPPTSPTRTPPPATVRVEPSSLKRSESSKENRTSESGSPFIPIVPGNKRRSRGILGRVLTFKIGSDKLAAPSVTKHPPVVQTAPEAPTAPAAQNSQETPNAPATPEAPTAQVTQNVPDAPNAPAAKNAPATPSAPAALTALIGPTTPEVPSSPTAQNAPATPRHHTPIATEDTNAEDNPENTLKSTKTFQIEATPDHRQIVPINTSGNVQVTCTFAPITAVETPQNTTDDFIPEIRSLLYDLIEKVTWDSVQLTKSPQESESPIQDLVIKQESNRDEDIYSSCESCSTGITVIEAKPKDETVEEVTQIQVDFQQQEFVQEKKASVEETSILKKEVHLSLKDQGGVITEVSQFQVQFVEFSNDPLCVAVPFSGESPDFEHTAEFEGCKRSRSLSSESSEDQILSSETDSLSSEDSYEGEYELEMDAGSKYAIRSRYGASAGSVKSRIEAREAPVKESGAKKIRPAVESRVFRNAPDLKSRMNKFASSDLENGNSPKEVKRSAAPRVRMRGAEQKENMKMIQTKSSVKDKISRSEITPRTRERKAKKEETIQISLSEKKPATDTSQKNGGNKKEEVSRSSSTLSVEFTAETSSPTRSSAESLDRIESASKTAIEEMKTIASSAAEVDDTRLDNDVTKESPTVNGSCVEDNSPKSEEPETTELDGHLADEGDLDAEPQGGVDETDTASIKSGSSKSSESEASSANHDEEAIMTTEVSTKESAVPADLSTEPCADDDVKTAQLDDVTTAQRDDVVTIKLNDVTITENDGVSVTKNDDVTISKNDDVTLSKNDDVTIAKNDDVTISENDDVTTIKVDDVTSTGKVEDDVTSNKPDDITEDVSEVTDEVTESVPTAGIPQVKEKVDDVASTTKSESSRDAKDKGLSEEKIAELRNRIRRRRNEPDTKTDCDLTKATELESDRKSESRRRRRNRGQKPSTSSPPSTPDADEAPGGNIGTESPPLEAKTPDAPEPRVKVEVTEPDQPKKSDIRVKRVRSMPDHIVDAISTTEVDFEKEQSPSAVKEPTQDKETPKEIPQTENTEETEPSSPPSMRYTIDNLGSVTEEAILEKLLYEAEEFEDRRKIRRAIRELRSKKLENGGNKKENQIKTWSTTKSASSTSTRALPNGSIKKESSETTASSAYIRKTRTPLDGKKEQNTKSLSDKYSGSSYTSTRKEMSSSSTKKVGSIFDREEEAPKRLQVDKRREVMRNRSMPASSAKDARKMFVAMDGNTGNKAVGRKVGRSPTSVVPNANNIKQMLLKWCQAKTRGYEHVDITNFSGSWANGMAFCALVHNFFPEAFDYASLDPKNRPKNFQLAFDAAEKLGEIPALLDTEDMVRMAEPDWKCVYTYITEFYKRIRELQLS